MMEYVIREAVSADLPAILSLYGQPDIDNGKVMDLETANTVFRRISRYPNYRIFVASAHGQIVGTYSLVILDNIAHMGAPSAVVEDVIVSADWRRQGVGKAMMTHAMSLCREAKCYKLALSSNLIRQPAHRFYEALGFTRHGFSFVIDFEEWA
jgi:GNAT superfamily N-acetyltransferase